MKQISFNSSRGLNEITEEVAKEISIHEGLVNLFCQHTSCSLIIMENADPTVLEDLEAWMSKNVPEDASQYVHSHEGDDDMPAHIKTALTQTSLNVPVSGGKLALGTWQGIYIWEHRDLPRRRTLLISEVEIK
jgi:secondary thiamine-phosphate synthase enzyme